MKNILKNKIVMISALLLIFVVAILIIILNMKEKDYVQTEKYKNEITAFINEFGYYQQTVYGQYSCDFYSKDCDMEFTDEYLIEYALGTKALNPDIKLNGEEKIVYATTIDKVIYDTFDKKIVSSKNSAYNNTYKGFFVKNDYGTNYNIEYIVDEITYRDNDYIVKVSHKDIFTGEVFKKSTFELKKIKNRNTYGFVVKGVRIEK